MDQQPQGPPQIDSLSTELVVRILCYASIPEVIRCLRTCQQLASFLNPGKNLQLWKPLFEAWYPDLTDHQNYFTEIRQRYVTDRAWSTGKIETFACKQDNRTACTFIGPNHIAWGTMEGKVMVRNLQDDLLQEFKPHEAVIWGMKVVGKRVYSCSNNDPFIGIYDIKSDMTLEVVHLIKSDEEEVVNMWVCEVTDKHIIGCDGGGHVHVWELETYKRVTRFKAPYGGVFSMDVYQGHVYLGTVSGNLAVYNYLTGEFIRKVHIKRDTSDSCLRGIHVLNKDFILAGEQFDTISSWNEQLESYWTISPEKGKEHDRILNEIGVFKNYMITLGVTLDACWLEIRTINDQKLLRSLEIPFNKIRTSRIYGFDASVFDGKICFAGAAINLIISVPLLEGGLSKAESKKDIKESQKCIIS